MAASRGRRQCTPMLLDDAIISVAIKEVDMDAGMLTEESWRALLLGIVVVAGLVWAFVFFLRKNREDLDSLEQTIELERKEDES